MQNTTSSIPLLVFTLSLLSGGCSVCDYDNYSGPGDMDYAVTCLNGSETCFCVNPKDAHADWGDDEAGESECGTVVFADGRIILSHHSCDPLVEQALEIADDVPFAYDYPQCDVPVKKHRCFTELELIDDGNPDNDLWCTFCPEITGIAVGGPTGPDFAICWDNAEDWDPATLDGAVPNDWDAEGWPDCESIEPPIGELVGYTLPMHCPAGVSCLGLNTGCSCNCRDANSVSIGPSESDYIAWWWQVYPSEMPALVDFDLPVEATCTGEPLVWAVNGIGQAWALGSTIELDGYDPAFPPNGELYHTPAWDLLPAAPYTLTSLPAAYISAVAAYPSEAQHGGSRVTMSETGAVVTACMRGSLCDRIGLALGDTLLGVSLGDAAVLVQYRDRGGFLRELRLGIE